MTTFRDVIVRFQRIFESDEERRKLERAAKESPNDRDTWKRYNTSLRRQGLKTVNMPRKPSELKSAARIMQRRSDKFSKTAVRNANYSNKNRIYNIHDRMKARESELKARSEGNKRAEIAAERARKLTKVIAKRVRSPEHKLYQNYGDPHFQRLSHLSSRATHQGWSLGNKKPIGDVHQSIQTSPPHSKDMSTRSRRKEGRYQTWKEYENQNRLDADKK